MTVFFRIDDLGWMPEEFNRVLDIFRKSGHKLNAAAIPMEVRKNYTIGAFSDDTETLEIHVHGYSHTNHQTEGKKSEFGSSRNSEAVRAEFKDGLNCIQEFFPQNFAPIFTPPWNRIADSYIPILSMTGYKALSRDGLQNGTGIENLNINVDPHTDKKNPNPANAESFWKLMPDNFEKPVGIMLHHKHMEEMDYKVLEDFLNLLNDRKIESAFMSELLH